MQKVMQIPMIFDDVKFGIDVRDARKKLEWTQEQLALAVGFKSGGAISLIECATQTDGISVRRYMSICNVCGLNPMHYWDFLPDIYAGREGWDERNVQ